MKNAGYIYPCSRSRKDVKAAAYAPHEEDEFAEPIFPPQWRPDPGAEKAYQRPGSEVSWRFRVPDGEVIKFTDIEQGELCFEAGKDFGDFVIWRRDDVPAYELAVVTDDIEHDISESTWNGPPPVNRATTVALSSPQGYPTRLVPPPSGLR